jgi:hypothetical protein
VKLLVLQYKSQHLEVLVGCPMKGLRIDRDMELIMYPAMNTTIAIFHLGGGDG